MDGQEYRGVREKAAAINVMLMHYIKSPGTDEDSHCVQYAGRDKGGHKSLSSFNSRFHL